MIGRYNKSAVLDVYLVSNRSTIPQYFLCLNRYSPRFNIPFFSSPLPLLSLFSFFNTFLFISRNTKSLYTAPSDTLKSALFLEPINKAALGHHIFNSPNVPVTSRSSAFGSHSRQPPPQPIPPPPTVPGTGLSGSCTRRAPQSRTSSKRQLQFQETSLARYYFSFGTFPHTWVRLGTRAMHRDEVANYGSACEFLRTSEERKDPPLSPIAMYADFCPRARHGTLQNSRLVAPWHTLISRVYMLHPRHFFEAINRLLSFPFYSITRTDLYLGGLQKIPAFLRCSFQLL